VKETPYDHYFWQLREIQRTLDRLQPQLRALDSIPLVDPGSDRSACYLAGRVHTTSFTKGISGICKPARAADAASNIEKTNRLYLIDSAADLLDEMNSGIESAVLMNPSLGDVVLSKVSLACSLALQPLQLVPPDLVSR
jgi:hypothetical protein